MKILVFEWVTGGGLAGRPIPPSLAAEGGSMLRAAAAEFAAAPGVSVTVTVDPRLRAQPAPAGASVQTWEGTERDLAGLAAGFHFTLVIAPETDDTLRRFVAAVEAGGGRTLNSSPDAVALTTDKLRLAAHLERAGVPTPPTAAYEGPGAACPFPFPVVVKPRDGAGCLDTFLAFLPEHLPPGRDGQVVQPLITGTSLSASYLVGEAGEPRLLGVGVQDVRAERGRFAYAGTLLPAPAELGRGEPWRAVRSVEGLRGFVGVDFLLAGDGRSSHVVEINPRLTTSFVGLTLLYPPGAVARAWLGTGELPPPPTAPGLPPRPRPVIPPDRPHDGGRP